MTRDTWNRRSNSIALCREMARRGVLLFLALFLLFALLSIAALPAHSQTIRVDQFAGNSVGEKLTFAQNLGCATDTNVTCILVIHPELSVFAQGTLPTPCSRCYWVDYRYGLAMTTASSFDVRTWGAKPDGVTDSTAAIAAADAAAPVRSINYGADASSSPTTCLYFPQGSGDYIVTGAVAVTFSRNGTCLRGQNPGVRIVNTTSGGTTLRFDRGTDATLTGARIENISILGTGATSRAVHGDALIHANFEFWSIGSGGYALYLDSSHFITGSLFGRFRVHAQPAAGTGTGVTGIFSSGGRSNTFEPRCREADVCMDLVNEIGSTIFEPYIESNLYGAKTGLRVGNTATSTAAGSGDPRRVLMIIGGHFENNPSYSIDADSGTYVQIANTRFDGGVDSSTCAATRVLKLDGGGSLTGVWASALKVESAAGQVRVRDTWGVYGLASVLKIEGATVFPLGAGANTATKSWFDTDPTWTNLGAPDPPTLSYDAAQDFYGEGSKKAVFPSTAGTFADSRTRIDQTITSVVAGDILSGYVAGKFGTASKCMAYTLRNNGGASETIHDFLFSTDTADWMIFAFQGKVPTGVTSAALSLTAVTQDLGASLDTWTGAVAIAKNAFPVLYNTDQPARGPYDVDAHTMRFRKLYPAYAEIPMCLAGIAGVNLCTTFTNLSAAFTESSQVGNRNNFDLSRYTDFRIVVNYSVAAVTGDVEVQCDSTYSFATPTTLGTLDNPAIDGTAGAWTAIPANECSTVGGVWIRVGMVNGNGTEDPTARAIRLQVR